jgi:hypothetical protein
MLFFLSNEERAIDNIYLECEGMIEIDPLKMQFNRRRLDLSPAMPINKCTYRATRTFINGR